MNILFIVTYVQYEMVVYYYFEVADWWVQNNNNLSKTIGVDSMWKMHLVKHISKEYTSNQQRYGIGWLFYWKSAAEIGDYKIVTSSSHTAFRGLFGTFFNGLMHGFMMISSTAAPVIH